MQNNFEGCARPTRSMFETHLHSYTHRMPRILRVIIMGRDYENMALEMNEVQRLYGSYKVEAMHGSCVILLLDHPHNNVVLPEDRNRLQDETPFTKYVFSE